MSKAVLKFIRLSPTKARLVAKQVQGMNAEEALAALEFTPNKAAGIIAKVIASAVANGGYEPEEVEVVSCRVDKGPVLRRFRPRARGSASRILKPTSHIMVEVAPAGESSVDSKPAKKAENKPAKKSEKKTESKTDTKKAEKKGDNLTKLKGVGKAYQEKLNNEGIYTFEDVANMTDEQIATMEEKYSFKGDFKETVADAKNIISKES